VITANFDYVVARSAEEAVAALAEHGEDAKLLAGGHSLIPLMKLRFSTPEVLIDIGQIRDLSYVRDEGSEIAIGALTRYRHLEIDGILREHLPLVAHVAGEIGDPQVRHRGTIGGSLAHGDAAADMPAVVLALGGTLVVQGPNGRRTIDATSFFEGFLETALAPDELLTEIRLPKMTGAGWSFQKFNRRALDWAIVGVAAVRNGSTGIALVNMGPTPVRATGVETALAGGASVAEAALLAAEGTEPPADLNADKDFRRHLAQVLVRRALEEAGANAATGH
jgi:carbon-monoxide dehydrogenase medium subunit